MLGKSRLKYIQSLGHKKHREQEGLFVAEGPKLAEELLASWPQQVEAVYAVDEWASRFAPAFSKFEITGVSEEELARMSQLATPNQVLVLLRIPEPVTELETRGRLTLCLDTIQDPGNLGTIIRIADWFGVTQLACSPSTADMWNPKVVQSTMGSIARVKLLYTPVVQWLAANSDTGLYAAALDGVPVGNIGKLAEGILIIGNESKGIDAAILQQVQHRVTIPRIGKAESLNAAVATGILLSHLT